MTFLFPFAMRKTLKESYKVLGLDGGATRGIEQETCFFIFAFELKNRYCLIFSRMPLQLFNKLLLSTLKQCSLVKRGQEEPAFRSVLKILMQGHTVHSFAFAFIQ